MIRPKPRQIKVEFTLGSSAHRRTSTVTEEFDDDVLNDELEERAYELALEWVSPYGEFKRLDAI